MIRNFPIIFLATGLLFMACNIEDDDPAPNPPAACEPVTLVLPFDSISTPSKLAQIDSAVVEGNELRLWGRYGGGCVEDDLIVIASVSPLAIFPPIINIAMYDRATDLCEALESGVGCSNISALRSQYPQATLQFEGSAPNLEIEP